MARWARRRSAHRAPDHRLRSGRHARTLHARALRRRFAARWGRAGLLAADRTRPMIGLEHAERGSVHPALLLMLVFADLFGAADPNVDFWGPPSFAWSATMGPSGIALAQNMGEIYCGILSVVLILGAGIVRGLAWASEIRFFTLALVLVLLYALGW